MSCEGVDPPTGLSIFTASASCLFCVLTVTGNALIISAVLIDPLKKLRTPFNYFLINLACADLVVGYITLPISVYLHGMEANDHLPTDLVPWIHMSTFISTLASVFSLAALSLDRLAAITWPIKYRTRLSIKRCASMSAGIWTISLSLPWAYFSIGYIDFLMVFIHIAVAATFAIMVVTYIRVYKEMRKQALAMNAIQRTAGWQSEVNLKKANHVEKKVTRVFLIILLLFMATYLPATAMIYVLRFCPTCNCALRHVLRDVQFLFVLSNSFMNPFVCMCMMKTFQESVRSLLARRPCGTNGKQDRSTSTMSVLQLNSCADSQLQSF